ncbi:hypothetical protein ACS0TY_012586 [Phlomoides rotata]
MLRKGISKAKSLSHLNMMMKSGKIAGKAAMHTLMFHHHHHHGGSASGRHLNKPKHSPPPPLSEEELMAAAVGMFDSAASPQLPGFGPSPMVRKLRVTDSPFPLRDVWEDSHVVDEAAEEFILKFYKDLRHQNSIAYLD